MDIFNKFKDIQTQLKMNSISSRINDIESQLDDVYIVKQCYCHCRICNKCHHCCKCTPEEVEKFKLELQKKKEQ